MVGGIFSGKERKCNLIICWSASQLIIRVNLTFVTDEVEFGNWLLIMTIIVLIKIAVKVGQIRFWGDDN